MVVKTSGTLGFMGNPPRISKGQYIITRHRPGPGKPKSHGFKPDFLNQKGTSIWVSTIFAQPPLSIFRFLVAEYPEYDLLNSSNISNINPLRQW